MTKTEFAELLNVTTRRVGQMLQSGELVREGTVGVDAVASLLGLYRAAKERRGVSDVRVRLSEAQIRGTELRHRRSVRRMLVVDEFEDLLLAFIDELWVAAQWSGAHVYAESAGQLGDDAAKQIAHAVHAQLRHVVRSHRDAAKALCAKIRGELLPDDIRVADVYRSLLPAELRRANADDVAR